MLARRHDGTFGVWGVSTYTQQTYLVIQPMQLCHKEVVEDSQVGGGSSKRVTPCGQDVADQFPQLVVQRARLPDVRQLPMEGGMSVRTRSE